MSGVLIMTIDYFPDPLEGKPISQGKIYVGEPDTDPTVPANQKTMTVLEEDGSLTNVTQPLRTSAGGVPVYNGSPVSIYVALPFSVTVLRSDDTQAYYIPSMGATDVIGDVLSTDGTKVLENGTDGTDATFTGDVTGDITGNVTGNLTGDVTGDMYSDDGTLAINNGATLPGFFIKTPVNIADATDATKRLDFDLSGATTNKTVTLLSSHTDDRTVTFPDASGTVQLSSTSGSTIQHVYTIDSAVATGTTTIPYDDTIPQITEGDEYITQAITPTSATNILKIEVAIYLSNTANASDLTVALFQDTTTDALAAVGHKYQTTAEGWPVNLIWYMVAGTTSSTTFRVRAGAANAGTTTFNGTAGGRIYGGVMASSISITEIAV
jgi:hypothetical protein